jgi:hypothetical protein
MKQSMLRLSFRLEVTPDFKFTEALISQYDPHAGQQTLTENRQRAAMIRFDPDDVAVMSNADTRRDLGGLFGFDYANMLAQRQLRREAAMEIGANLMDDWLKMIEAQEGWPDAKEENSDG